MSVHLASAGALVLLYFVLAYLVSRARMRHRVGVGAGEDPDGPVNRAVRAHGNAAEYLPLFVAILLYQHLAGAAAWTQWVAVAIVVSRVLHAVGIYTARTLNARNTFRFIGALGTYLCGFALGVALLLDAL